MDETCSYCDCKLSRYELAFFVHCCSECYELWECNEDEYEDEYEDE